MAERALGLEEVAARARGTHAIEASLDLWLGACSIRVLSNAPELIDALRAYYRPFVARTAVARPTFTVVALEAEPPELGLPWRDWPREPGKTKRKEEFVDLDGGRAIRKVRTRMQFVIGATERIAVGPARANDNQVVNFVNAQYVSWLLDSGWVLCHAAALAREGRGLAFAASSGGGKSTLALHVLRPGFAFVSNDRVLMRRDDDGSMRMSGIPKLPRINPGTALHNESLRDVLPPERRRALAHLDADELWELEEKYDVDVERAFDGVAFELEARLDGLVVLSWDRRASGRTELVPVSLAERPDLLAAVMKSPGPFHLPTAGIAVDEGAYLAQLGGLRTWEARGRVDFAAARRRCLELLGD